MIDYLEGLFSIPRQDREQARQVRAALPEGEEPQWGRLPRAEEEAVAEMVLPRMGEEEIQLRTLTRPGEERPEEGRGERVSLRRVQVNGESEGLERRLRRESRRYDCGFYWA